MPDLSRRALFGASAATALFAAMPPAWAEGATITSPVWDLTDLYSGDAEDYQLRAARRAQLEDADTLRRMRAL